MANLILQHWNNLNGKSMPEWASCATQTIRKYSQSIGVEYRLIDGWPMGEFRGAVSQKLALILEEYDEYDQVLMLDADMIATRHIDDVFQYEGIGRLHLKAMSSQQATKQGKYWPNLYRQGEPLFFGNFIKLTREERQALRKHIPSEEMCNENMSDPSLSRFKTSMPPNDEQQMHWMIHQSGILKDKKQLMVPHDRFCDLPEEAHPQATMMHYCNSRKNQIPDAVRKIYGLEIL